MAKIEDKIKKALIKDFKNLFVMEFSTNWRAERIKAELEIGVMSLDNIEAVIAESNREYGLKLLIRFINKQENIEGAWRKYRGVMNYGEFAFDYLDDKKENDNNP